MLRFSEWLVSRGGVVIDSASMKAAAAGWSKARSFDVVCVGEARWKLKSRAGASKAAGEPVRLRPGGGAIHVAVAMARAGLRVGLATAIEDDSRGRALLDVVGGCGVDVGGVALVAPHSGLVLVTGAGAAPVVPHREGNHPIAVPAGWSSQVVLLSGLSAVLSYGAALCKAARAGRRQGSIVMIDINANRHFWLGRDPRTILMVLREADVVRCSAQDCAALGMDIGKIRDALRPSAVLVASDGGGSTWATGPFGQIARPRRDKALLRSPGAGDLFTAGICAELAKSGRAAEHEMGAWERALERGEAASRAARRPAARR